MLINLKEMLTVAKDNHFAVAAFNTTDLALVRAVVEEAEATNTPAILQFAPGEFNYATPLFYKYVTERLSTSKVAFVLHYDHGKSIENCVAAMDVGFTSVMFDGSDLSYLENKKITKEIVDIAHKRNVSVEAELGTIGAMTTSDEGGVDVNNITYTNPEDVVDFISDTKCDALAIAIGTAHGLYPEDYKPQLQLELLGTIVSKTKTPLVLHGGSDNPDDEIAEACRIGVQKINISSDVKKVFFKKINDIYTTTGNILAPQVFNPAILEARVVIHNKMELFGSLGKSNLYK
ncbi:MAG: ketose-bisphosphate aldolase [Erysipelotrichaceae bacterium]